VKWRERVCVLLVWRAQKQILKVRDGGAALFHDMPWTKKLLSNGGTDKVRVYAILFNKFSSFQKVFSRDRRKI